MLAPVSFATEPASFETRQLTTRSGATLDLTVLGLGTAGLGNLYRAIDEDTAHLALEAAWATGVRYFDTAPLYGLGLAETRLNGFLRRRPRESYVVSTKVGRLLQPCAPEERSAAGKFFETPARREVFDYSYNGVMRSLEFSLERLGLDFVDILLVHDVDAFTHGSREAADARLKELMGSGYAALEKLRREGVVKAIGAGVNEWQAADALARTGEFDLFLLAGRYTLLEQDALASFLPLCEARKIGVVIGGPFNSGILASGAKAGAFYDYDRAPAAVLDKVARLEKVCAAHKVRLAEAALQFPLGHPAVLSVVPGAQAAHEVIRNAEAMRAPLPAALWDDLRADGLVRESAPVPG
jgi:D-threo-aldose 1-dehydrogenase